MVRTNTQIPVCPKCKHHHTLVLTDNLLITCIRSAGGCGAEFDVSKVATLYQQMDEQLNSIIDGTMHAEGDAWQSIVRELKALDMDINTPRLTPLVKAIALWGERLVALRVNQDDALRKRVLVESIDAYWHYQSDSR